MDRRSLPALILLFALAIGRSAAHADNNPLHIALAGPLQGSGSDVGKGLRNGIQLYLDEINRKGGIGDREVVLDLYNDGNDKKQAAVAAAEIVKENRALAVIGHWYSSCSLAAGPLYAEAGIVAVSPGSTNVKVTAGNDWYFRTVFNDQAQGSYLATHAVKSLGHPRVTVIREDLPFGDYLGEVFEKSVERMGGTVDTVYRVITGAEDVEQQVAQIADAIAARGEPAGLIFLATHAREAIALVHAFRDRDIANAIMAPDAAASVEFRDGFNHLPLEQRRPGFYTNGIYISSPINFDAANEEAQRFLNRFRARYGAEPGWMAAYGYDAAKVIVQAARDAQIGGTPETLQADRRAIRDQMAMMTTAERAVKGVTGLNLFDENGDVDKPVALSQYRNRTMVSAMTHLTMVPDPGALPDLQEALAAGRIIESGGHYMYKTDVVYTGARMEQLGPYDPKSGVIELAFTLWFRYQGDIAPQQIEFINAVEPIELGKPIHRYDTGKLHYRAYRVKGRFRTNFLPSRTVLGEHVAGFMFRNKEQPRHSLLYVSDVVGMGLNSNNKLVEKLNDDEIDQLADWRITDAKFFENSAHLDTLGIPEYMDRSELTIPFSQFHLAMDIERSELSLRELVPPKQSGTIALIAAAVLLLIHLVSRLVEGAEAHQRLLWIGRVCAAPTLLLSAELWLVDHYLLESEPYLQELVVKGFDILWWFVPAVLVSAAIEAFIWLPLERATGRQVPGVVRGIVSSFVYVLALFGVIAFVFDQKLTGLLATSGLFAMIIGLALQVNLSNIFSGIALNLEHPFRVGDRVKITDQRNAVEGKVIDINWRATRLLTTGNYMLTIPNTPVASAHIHNYSILPNASRLMIDLEVHPNHPVAEVKRNVINAALAVPKVLQSPRPAASFKGIVNGTATYRLTFSIDNYEERNRVTEAVWTNLTRRLGEAGIQFATAGQRVEWSRADSPGPLAAVDLPTLLQGSELFQPLPEEEINALLEHSSRHQVAAGERFIKQGDNSDSLFVVTDGVVAVYWREPQSQTEIEVGRLGAGTTVGAKAVLNGAPRSASVEAITRASLLEIPREVLQAIFDRFPEVLQTLNETLDEQMSETRSKADYYRKEKRAKTALYQRLWKEMGRRFGTVLQNNHDDDGKEL